MTATRGAGRTLAAGGTDGQVVAQGSEGDSTWEDNGARSLVKPTVTGTVKFGDVAIVDTTAGAVDLTLPTPTSANQAPITIKRQTGSNTLRALGTINGSTNLTITTAVTLFTDGTNWFTG